MWHVAWFHEQNRGRKNISKKIVYKRSEPHFPESPPIWPTPSSIYIFSLNRPLLSTFFNNTTPMKYEINTKTPQEERHFFVLRKLQNNITCFFSKKHFCKQNQTEIWFEKLIKLLSKERYCSNIHTLLMTKVPTPSSINNLPYLQQNTKFPKISAVIKIFSVF